MAVTAGSWTLKAVDSHATYTVCYLNGEWKLTSHIFATHALGGRHTAQRIANHFDKTAVEFGIASKLVGVDHN